MSETPIKNCYFKCSDCGWVLTCLYTFDAANYIAVNHWREQKHTIQVFRKSNNGLMDMLMAEHQATKKPAFDYNAPMPTSTYGVSGLPAVEWKQTQSEVSVTGPDHMFALSFPNVAEWQRKMINKLKPEQAGSECGRCRNGMVCEHQRTRGW